MKRKKERMVFRVELYSSEDGSETYAYAYTHSSVKHKFEVRLEGPKRKTREKVEEDAAELEKVCHGIGRSLGYDSEVEWNL